MLIQFNNVISVSGFGIARGFPDTGVHSLRGEGIAQGHAAGANTINEPLRFKPLLFLGGDAYAQASLSFRSLSVSGEGDEPEPEVAQAILDFEQLGSAGWSPTGSANTSTEMSFAPLVGVGSEGPYAFADLSLRPMRVLGVDELVELDGGTLDQPLLELTGSGIETTGSSDLVQPLSEIEGEFGWGTALDQPNHELEIEATVDVIGRGDIVQPAHGLEAFGTVGGMGRALDLRQPLSTLEGLGGWQAELDHPRSELFIEASFDGLGRLDQVLPRSEIEAEGAEANWGRAELDQPESELAPIGLLIIDQPTVALAASGGEVLDTPAYAAYAVNLRNAGVTTYTNQPFRRILRYRDAYYGIGPTGIFRLDGTMDDEEKIRTIIETGRPDFGNALFKRVTHTYALVNTNENIKVVSVTGDGHERAHTARGSVRDGLHTRRVKFGRGVKARNWGVRIEHEGKDRFELHDLELLGEVLRRKIS